MKKVDTYFEPGQLKIVVLPRGHVVIGIFYREGEDCRLENCKIIRRWGTTAGLGQLALTGKTSDTVLDETGTIHFRNTAIIFLLDCNHEKWTDLFHK